MAARETIRGFAAKPLRSYLLFLKNSWNAYKLGFWAGINHFSWKKRTVLANYTDSGCFAQFLCYFFGVQPKSQLSMYLQTAIKCKATYLILTSWATIASTSWATIAGTSWATIAGTSWAMIASTSWATIAGTSWATIAGTSWATIAGTSWAMISAEF